MNKKIIFPMLTVLALAGCTSEPKIVPTMESEEMAAYIPGLTLKGLDDVRGNMYLPEEVDGLPITWTCDEPNIIHCEAIGDIAPGSVERPLADTTVLLTASITKDGKVGSYTQEVTVKGLDRELTEDDYVGYLLVTFTGEGSANGEQVYMSLAPEGKGFNFQSLNGNQPILSSIASEKGVRDPYICRSHEGDKFFMLATDLSIYNRGGWGTSAGQNASKEGSYNLIKWESTDLVNWGEPEEIKVAPENAGMAWAPEMVYCEETGEYVIISSSSIVNENRSAKTLPDHIYYVTTRDFKHFSESKPFLLGQPKNPSTLEYSDDGKADMSDRRLIIDASVLRVGDYYYCAAKDGDNDEANGNIRLFRSETLFDWRSWEYVTDLDELGIAPNNSRDGIGKFDNSQLEGPELFRFNKKDWASEDTPEYGIMADRYMRQDLGYLPFKTTDFEDRKNENGSWSILDKSQYAFQGGTYRHGSVMNITAAEMERLKEAYPAKN